MRSKSERILLIYPFGNNDVTYNGEARFPQGQDFRAHLKVLSTFLETEAQSEVQAVKEENEAFPSGLDFTAYPIEKRRTVRKDQNKQTAAFVIKTLRFPILFDVLGNLFREGQTVFIKPIVTDQQNPNEQDTIGISALLRVYAFILNGTGKSYQLHIDSNPFVLKADPTNYNDISPRYGDLYKEIEPTLGNFDRVYLNITTGTPAMSFIAGLTFASDSRITFVYKPRHIGQLIRVTTFRDQVRRETLHRVRDLLDRFDFFGAYKVVDSPMNGFTLAERKKTKVILLALAAWQNYDFQEVEIIFENATQILESVPSNDSTSAFRLLCRRLAEENQTPDQRAIFWKTKLLDTMMRLGIAVSRHDLPDVLYHFYNYTDVCLAWGLNAHFPQLDLIAGRSDDAVREIQSDFRRRCPIGSLNWKLLSEKDKFQVLFTLYQENKHSLSEGFQHWFSIHEPLRWFQDHHVDDIRNRLVHGSVQLQERLFDQLFEECLQVWGVDKPLLSRRQGPRLLFGLTYRSFEALPNTHPSDANCITELVSQAWHTLAQHADPPIPPPAAWVLPEEDQAILTDKFKERMDNAFHQAIATMQKGLKKKAEIWKSEIQSEVDAPEFATTRRKRRMAKELRQSDYQAPRWGHYMVHRFINDDPNAHKRVIKFEILATLHSDFDLKKVPNPNSVRNKIDDYLKGEISFQSLFDSINSS